MPFGDEANRILDRLEEIYRMVDAALPHHEGNACGGCDICCKAKMRHGVRLVELALIARYFERTGSRHTSETFRKFCAARHRIKDHGILYCPMYNRAAKSCTIYPVRPFSCRLYGMYTIRRESLPPSCAFRKSVVYVPDNEKYARIPGAREAMELDGEFRLLDCVTEEQKKAIYYSVGVALYKGGMPKEAESYLRNSLGIDTFRGASNLYLAMLYLTEHYSGAGGGRIADLDLMDSPAEEILVSETDREEDLDALSLEIPQPDKAPMDDRDMLELAEAAIRDAISLEPETPLARFLLGNVYMARGEHGKAVEELREAVRLDPRLALARHALGEVYHALGLPDEAVKEYEEASWIDRTFAMPHIGLGIIHYERGDLKKAADAFSRAGQLAPKSAVPLFNLGNVHYAAGDLSRAIAEFKRALEREEAPHILNNLGVALLDAGLLDEARSYLERAAAVLTDYLPLYLNMQRLYLERREYDKSLEASRKSLQLEPGSAQAYHLLGRLHFEQGNMSESAEALAKAIELDPEMSEAYNSLGFLRLNQNALDSAEELMRKALEKNPRNALAHNNMGLLNVSRGKADDAAACFKRAIDLCPTSAQFHFNLALVRMQGGDVKSAKESLRNALRCHESFVPALLALGNIYAGEKNTTDALRQFRRVLEADPSNAAAKNAVAFLTKK
jgi:tetratricopeptide (TPR) repeat protein